MNIIKKISVIMFLAIFLSFSNSCSESRFFSEDDTKSYYDEHQESFSILVSFFSRFEYSSISINSANSKMLVSDGLYDDYKLNFFEVEIKEQEVLRAISDLINSGCISICETEDTVVFLLSRKFNNFGSGVVYCVDEISEKAIAYLTKLVPLSSTGWYYYEEDFNAWDAKN